MLSIGCGHLHAIPFGTATFGFAIERHALQASRVVAHRSLVICSDGHLAVLRVDALAARTISSFEAQELRGRETTS